MCQDLEAGERWYVARTLPHRDNHAQFNLNRQGLRCFAPKVQRTVRHARKLRTVLAPLFPGYIFVILDLSKHRWRSVNGTIGVASLIMGAEQPLPVPPGVVEALIASSESSQIVRLDPGLEIGQRVRILSGPFAEALCELVHLDEKGRVRVLLEIMGGQVAVRPLAERRGFFSWGTAGSRPDEIRVLRLQQVAALPAPIKAARPFRHDAFEAKIRALANTTALRMIDHAITTGRYAEA